MKKLFFLLFVPTAFCHAEQFDRLLRCLEGSFTNHAQARADSEFTEIHLHMARIRSHCRNTAWFYVEQARADCPDPPYRQRIYKLTKLDDSLFVSEVFEIDHAEEFIGAWRNPERLVDFSESRLLPRSGCAVYLWLEPDGSFSGRTIDKECPSRRNDAAYMMTEVKITEKQFISWDRGFDMDGNQVWGSVKGGYIFDKTEEKP